MQTYKIVIYIIITKNKCFSFKKFVMFRLEIRRMLFIFVIQKL